MCAACLKDLLQMQGHIPHSSSTNYNHGTQNLSSCLQNYEAVHYTALFIHKDMIDSVQCGYVEVLILQAFITHISIKVSQISKSQKLGGAQKISSYLRLHLLMSNTLNMMCFQGGRGISLSCWAAGDKLTFAPFDLFIDTVNADSAAQSITLSNQNRT